MIVLATPVISVPDRRYPHPANVAALVAPALSASVFLNPLRCCFDSRLISVIDGAILDRPSAYEITYGQFGIARAPRSAICPHERSPQCNFSSNPSVPRFQDEMEESPEIVARGTTFADGIQTSIHDLLPFLEHCDA
jgi:hypothetical protein